MNQSDSLSEKFPPDFRLGPWLVQPALNRVEGTAGPVQIEPRVMAVLLCLARQEGRVWTRQELLDEVWPDTVVGEEILTRAVSQLRRVFGDSARDPRYIETIRNHGYRLIASKEVVAAEVTPDAAPGAVPEPPIAEPISEPIAEPIAESIAESIAEPITDPAPPQAKQQSRPWVWPLLAAVVALTLGAIIFWPQAEDADPSLRENSITATARPLTSFPGREWHPALSPDGTRVIFIRHLPGADHSDLFLKQVDSEAQLQLTEGPGWVAWPTWSADGQTVAFARGSNQGSTLCTVSSLGGSVRELLQVSSDIAGLDWSSDDRHLVYSALDPESGQYRLFLFSLAGFSVRPLTDEPNGAGDHQPRYSPDGEKLAWVRLAQDGSSHLVVSSAQGADQQSISPTLSQVQGLAWSADGRSLVYATASAGFYGLWEIDVPETGAPTATPRSIPTRGDFAWNPTVARQTGQMAFEQVQVDQDLWRIQVLNRKPWQLQTEPFAPSTRWEYEASYSPDGQQVAFISARSGSPQIWLADAEGANLSQLTQLPETALSQLCWSPDGAKLAFNRSSAGRQEMIVIASRGGTAQLLTPPGQQEILSQWSSGGHGLLFSSPRDGSWEIYRRRLEVSASSKVTRTGGLSAQESTDGQFLYHTRPGRAGLWRLPLENGVAQSDVQPELIIADLARMDRHNWLLRGDNIFWVLRSGNSAILVEYDLLTGASSFITDLPGFSAAGLTVSGSAEAFIFSRTGQMQGDLMIFPK